MSRSLAFALVAAALASTAVSFAQEPTARRPLPAPWFSIDRVSPTTGTGILPDDVLLHPGPLVTVPANNLGLTLANDELDGLSEGNDTVLPLDTFVLLFGVSRNTVGAIPPDPTLVGLGLPFNVFDQASRGQAAGDLFMSLTLFDRASGPLPLAFAIPNNTEVRNQGDAGGVGYSLFPPVAPTVTVPPPIDAQDAGFVPKPIALATVSRVYFSIDRVSPSRVLLPPPASGATVYLDNNLAAAGGENVYAMPIMMGLLDNDEIDALLVFDDGDGFFNPPLDQILFSLAPGSPSLLGNSPADVFTTQNFGVFNIFANAAVLGLLPSDDLTMLDFAPCHDPIPCAEEWAIGFFRRIPGDLNCDLVVDNFDIDAFIVALLNPEFYGLLYPECNIWAADCDGNGYIDNFDIDPFVRLVTGT